MDPKTMYLPHVFTPYSVLIVISPPRKVVLYCFHCSCVPNVEYIFSSCERDVRLSAGKGGLQITYCEYRIALSSSFLLKEVEYGFVFREMAHFEGKSEDHRESCVIVLLCSRCIPESVQYKISGINCCMRAPSSVVGRRRSTRVDEGKKGLKSSRDKIARHEP